MKYKLSIIFTFAIYSHRYMFGLTAAGFTILSSYFVSTVLWSIACREYARQLLSVPAMSVDV